MALVEVVRLVERAAKVARQAHLGHYAVAALALVGSPVRRLAAAVGAGYDKWAEARHQAREDEKLWNLALTDARVMADLRSEAPYPRDELFRTSAEYAHLCRVASSTLKQAIAA